MLLLRYEMTRTGVCRRAAVRQYLALRRLLGGLGDELVLLRDRVQNNLAQLKLMFGRQLLGLKVYLGALLVKTVFVDVRVGRLV